MGNFVQAILFHDRNERNTGLEYSNIHKIPVKYIENLPDTNIGELMKDKKITVIVIVASKWAFAHKMYVEFVNVYEEYKDYGL